MNTAVVYDLSRYRRFERVLNACEDTSAPLQDWKQVDVRITELVRERAAHEREVCQRLLEAERLAVPKRLGFASLREYANRKEANKRTPNKEQELEFSERGGANSRSCSC